MTFAFRLENSCPTSHARTGVFETPHGEVRTPAFMPVGTRGTVKGVLPRDLREAGATMILANTLHLHLRPGEEVVKKLGGLHRFMNWDGPILTDSGGYQVFSMSNLRRLDEEGVTFQSIVDGAQVHLSPESAMDIQRDLGADVIMAFDHCAEDPTDRELVCDATERTQRWMDRCVKRWRENGGLESGQALFGIVQGGNFADLRRSSVEAICAHDLVGYAVGGISVGEDREALRSTFAMATPLLPREKPRYLMGIGTPPDFFDAVSEGADMFDCVSPTRHGRTHQAFTRFGRVNLRNSGWREDPQPLDSECGCPACRGYAVGVLRHLCNTNEMIAATLVTLHNLHFFHGLMARIREAIPTGGLERLRESVLAESERRLQPGDRRG